MQKIMLPVAVMAVGLLLTVFSFFSSASGGEIDIEIDKAAFIMPAAHNVYANSEALNGKYYLFKAKVTNTSDATLEDVVVRYRVPGYIEWTEITEIGEMFGGQTASIVCYPKFKEDITEKMTESVEKAEIDISWDGADEDDIIEEEFSFKIVNRNDYVFTNLPAEEIAGWADVFSNDDLLACYVTPNDPIVKYYTQIVQEKVLKGEAASVSKDPKEAVRFMLGIYEATRMAHMVYSGTKGIPQSLDDVSSFSQHNRLPREVITGNTGLCLELSLLYASVMSSAGIDPIIYLIPGHAYPGFRMNGQYYAIEATAIGGEGLGSIGSAEDAFNKGQKELQEFIQKAQMGDPRYSIVDVHALNADGATPMALRDDAFLRKKVDEIAANFGGGGFELTQNDGNGGMVQNTGGGGQSSGGAAGRRSPGPLAFSIPGGWQTASYPFPQMPIVSFSAWSPDQSANAVVYDVPASTVQEAMYFVAQELRNIGSQVEFQVNGNHVQGNTYSANGQYVWKGKAAATAGGIRIVAVGSPQPFYNRWSATINSVYNSIR
ncbi:MAG: hypothetical protein AAF206_11315 [Bacteroidota bacterium]